MKNVRCLLSALPMLLVACANHETQSQAGDGGEAGHDDHLSSEPDPESTDDREDATESRFERVPSSALLVANGGTAEVTLIDATTFEVVGSLEVMAGMHPHHLGVSPDGSKVLLTATSADLSAGHGAQGGHGAHGGAAASTTLVYQLDVESGQLTNVLQVDATAHNAAFTRDGSTIVLGMMEHGMIAGYDATSFAESFTAGGFEMPLEVTPTRAGAVLVAESGAGKVAVFDPSAQSIVERFDVGELPVAAWASGAGSYFVAAEEGRQLRHLVESDSDITMDAHVIELDGMPGQATLTPDGSELWVALEDAGKVVVLDSETHAVAAEVQAGTKPHGVVFSRDGAHAFVTDEEGGDVLVVDVAERSVLRQISLGGKPNGIVLLSQ